MIAYHFDGKSAASQRAISWSENLYTCNILPIIITTSKNDRIIHTDKYELHFVSDNNRNHFNQYTGKYNYLISFLEPFRGFSKTDHLFRYTCNLLKIENNIKLIITSVGPFSLIRYGYMLKKRFNLKWIIDYRDLWTHDPIKWYRGNAFKFRYQKLLEVFRIEKKYIALADALIVVSGNHEEIFKSKFNFNKSIYLIPNGYRSELINSISASTLYSKLTIVYNGSVYNNQKLQNFIYALADVMKESENHKIVRLLFIGTEKNRIEKWLNAISIPNNLKVICFPRITPIKLLSIIKRSHISLIADYASTKGIIPTKVYDSVGLSKPILVSNAQVNSSLVQFAYNYGNAYIAFTNTELKQYIFQLINDILPPKEILIDQTIYSRTNWIPFLSNIVVNQINI